MSGAIEHFRLMGRFNAWVNARLFDVVASLPPEAYRRERGLYFGSIHATLNHLLLVDRLWSRRIEERPHGFTRLDQILYDDFAELAAARQEEDRRLIALVEELDEARLGASVHYTRMLGAGLKQARLGHILITLFNHQTHHRGQVHAALTQEGLEPPGGDVIFFLEEIGLAGDAAP